MVWTIEAKILPLVGGISGHLYLEIFDDEGDRLCQINGLATNPTTGGPRSIGVPGDLLKVYFGGKFTGRHLGNTAVFNRNNHPHKGCVLFQGSEEDVLKALEAVRTATDYLNGLDLPYRVMTLNSNSIFIHLVETMSAVIDIDQKAVAEVRRIKKILPGVHKKITEKDSHTLRKKFKKAWEKIRPSRDRKKPPPVPPNPDFF